MKYIKTNVYIARNNKYNWLINAKLCKSKNVKNTIIIVYIYMRLIIYWRLKYNGYDRLFVSGNLTFT